MITAFVMMNVERHNIAETAQVLLDIPGVAEVYSVTGEWDLVAILRTAEYEEIANVVTGRFTRVEAITRTHTLMAFQCYSNRDMERLWSLGDDEGMRTPSEIVSESTVTSACADIQQANNRTAVSTLPHKVIDLGQHVVGYFNRLRVHFVRALRNDHVHHLVHDAHIRLLEKSLVEPSQAVFTGRTGCGRS